MAKVPYIPLYIGDWEQDTNCLSLKAEAAWLKIIFKMWKNDKSGIYKTPTKALQNLWKCSAADISEIISELIENDICNIEEIEGGAGFIFKNRRMIKAKKISRTRSEAVQSRYKPSTNTSTKTIQNAEYDNEYDNEIREDKEGPEGKGEIKTDPGAFLVPRMFTIWKKQFPKYVFIQENDFPALHDLAYTLCDQLAKPKDFADKAICDAVISLWEAVAAHISQNSHYSTYSLQQVLKYIQGILQSYHKPKAPDKSGLQYLYDRFCDEGKADFRLITIELFQELEAKQLVKVDDALIKQVKATRLKNLEQPMNAEERDLHLAYKAGDPENELVKKDAERILFNAQRTAVINYFKKRKASGSKTVI
jgi:uncharacterized protein YdaU (DUF1376 family)